MFFDFRQTGRITLHDGAGTAHLKRPFSYQHFEFFSKLSFQPAADNSSQYVSEPGYDQPGPFCPLTSSGLVTPAPRRWAKLDLSAVTRAYF